VTNGDRRALERFNTWWDEGMHHMLREVAVGPSPIVLTKAQTERLNTILDRCGTIDET